MLKVILALSLLAGACLAGHHGHCCSSEDRQEVQKAWHAIWGAQFTGRRSAIAKAVFSDLFEHHPEVKAVFKGVNADDLNSAQFVSHAIRVMNGLDIAINLLGDPAALDAELAHLSTQHQAREGVTKAYFDAIQESFDRVLPQVSSCFNPDAFNRCFERVKRGITEGLP